MFSKCVWLTLARRSEASYTGVKDIQKDSLCAYRVIDNPATKARLMSRVLGISRLFKVSDACGLCEVPNILTELIRNR